MKKQPTPDDFDFDLDLEPHPAYTVIPPIKMAEAKTMPLLDKLEKLIDVAESCRLHD